MTVPGYVPALGERDLDKIIRAVRNLYENAASTADIAVKVPAFATRAAAAAATIDSNTNAIVTAGYSASGDGGGARYYRLGAVNTATNYGGFQSADGTYWALNEPVANVLMFGADNTNNSSTDSSSAFQAALNYAVYYASTGGGKGAKIYIPGGSYYLGSQVNFPDVAGISVIMEGAGVQATNIFAKSNINMFVVQGDATIRDCWFYGYNDPTVNTYIIILSSVTNNPAAAATVERCNFYYGYEALLIETGEIQVRDCHIAYNYHAGVHSFSSFYADNVYFDQGYPYSTPSFNFSVSAWTGTHGYTAGNIATVTHFGRSWYLQCTQSGTSGSVEPTPLGYFATITDGTARWQLMAPTDLYGAYLDSGDGISNGSQQCIFTRCDFQGPHTGDIIVTNTSGGAAGVYPFMLTCHATAFGGMGNHIYLDVCKYAAISECQFAGTQLSGSYCVLLGANASFATLTGNVFYGNGTFSGYSNAGVYVLSGSTKHTITGNYFGPMSGTPGAGVYVTAGVTDFVINSNYFDGSTIGVRVDTGASDYYTIANNIAHTCTTGISDAGTGTHKTVSGNV